MIGDGAGKAGGVVVGMALISSMVRSIARARSAI